MRFLMIILLLFILLYVISIIMKMRISYDEDEKNVMEGKKVIFVEDDTCKENADGVKGKLVAVDKDVVYTENFYSRYVKRALDIVVSFFGLIVLSPIFFILCIAIYIDDPGNVFFSQKRVGKNKRYFELHKFRSMKLSAPHNTPTHMLDNPDQYITKIGSFIRKHSIDELPQIWDIFIGNMSIVGPRPALWNQDLLIAERDKYNANDIKPGLTGLAQINGRDELSIYEKAKYDGEYAQNLTFAMDFNCFFKTILKVLNRDGIVEGNSKNK